MNNVMNAALAFAEQGVRVLPLHSIKPDGGCSCGGKEKNPNCKPGKHPYGKLVSHGVSEATDNPETLRKWFADGRLNLGIATGAASGIFAVDQDDRDGGHLSVQDLEEKHGSLPTTLTQRTGNGKHFLFKMPPGVDIRNSQKALAPGIDVRGTGGYIVAAPSQHESGRNYEFIGSTGFDRSMIADAPDWLIELVAYKAKPPTVQVGNNGSLSQGNTFHIPDRIADGEGREGFLLQYAGHLRSRQVGQDVIEQILLDFNQQRIDPPLDETVVLDRARRFEHPCIEPQGLQPTPSSPIESGEWPMHEEIVDTLPSVPAFPLALLPKSISAYASDIAERMSCPVEFAAVGLLTTLASAIGGQIHIKPEEFGTWMVPAGIWAMTVSPPSSIKTPPLSEALRPLRNLDREAAEQHRLAIQQYEIDKGIYDKGIKSAIQSGNNNPGLVEPIKPGMKRYIVNDTTYEKLIEIAQANQDGILVFRDELVGWFHSLNKENQKEARGLYLTGWAGTESYATDRIGRGHVRADRVNISLLGTIQPNVVRQIVYDAVSGGGGDDGLIARFQLAVYPDPTREYKKLNRHPDYAAQASYEALVKELTQLDLARIGALLDPTGAPYLPFSAEAQVCFDKWRASLESSLRDPATEEHPAMLAHLGKYRSLVPKMGLILHLVAGNAGPVDVNATKRAIGWARLLESHARRIYHTATNRTMQASCALANKIKAKRLSNGFTRSDVLTKEWAGLRTAEEVNSALTVLRDKYWLIAKEDRRTGGRPTERFYINPSVKVQG